MFIFTKWIAVFVSSAALICAAHAQDYAGRKELKRSDLTGTNMEVIVSISETKPGETLPRHFHNGEEAFYTLDDTTIELPDGKQISVKAGNAGSTTAQNKRRTNASVGGLFLSREAFGMSPIGPGCVKT